jgi:hypothetical protein
LGEKVKFSAWFSIIVGVLMFGQWGFFLAAGAVPELVTEPVRIVFHLAAEFVTAACLIVSGIALLRGKLFAKGMGLFAAGMLAYTAIVSPGYFAQQGQWPLVGMFAVILALDIVSAIRLQSTQI